MIGQLFFEVDCEIVDTCLRVESLSELLVLKTYGRMRVDCGPAGRSFFLPVWISSTSAAVRGSR